MVVEKENKADNDSPKMMKKKWEVSSAREFGLSGGDRTPDPQLRRLMLYPAELRAEATQDASIWHVLAVAGLRTVREA